MRVRGSFSLAHISKRGKILLSPDVTEEGIMPDELTPVDLKHVVAEEKKQQNAASLASNIPGALDVAVDMAEPVVEAAVEAGGTLLEGAVEAVGDVIGTVIGGIFDS
jgi:hypothetical protein